MRTAVLLLLLALCLASCHKEVIDIQKPAQKSVANRDTIRDTIPDMAGFKIKLYPQDTTQYDDTMFLFDHRSGRDFDPNKDAAYLPGYGQVSLASISGDGKDLAIYRLPYKHGMSVGLDFHTKTEGRFSLTLSYRNKIPANLHIWLRDALVKKSTDLCAGAYTFNVSNADANSFGDKRFSLVLGEKPQ